jgi:hypothetical protein
MIGYLPCEKVEGLSHFQNHNRTAITTVFTKINYTQRYIYESFDKITSRQK